MTWLRGTSTWGQFEHLLARLMCGEVSDDFATTNAVGSRWIREVSRTVTDLVTNGTTTITSATASFTSADVGALVIASGVTLGTTIASVSSGTTAVMSAAATASASGVTAQFATNTLRTPSSKDVASGNMSTRAGYWALAGNLGNAGLVDIQSTYNGINSVCKQTSAASSNPASGAFNRYVVELRCITANTVSGNYSTASFLEYAKDPDTGSFYTVGTTRTPNSSGVITLATNGATVAVSDPSGFLSVGAAWARGFTSVYTYGIDHWPMWYRSAASSPTFSVNPPGVAGTDYDVLSIPVPNLSVLNAVYDNSGFFHGLGIKTSTGLGSNALYTLSFPMAYIKQRIFASSGGVLSCDFGQSKRDNVNTNGTFRVVGGPRITTWLKCAQTAGSVTSTTALQYWVSVTADGVVVVINMDSGATGKLGIGFTCTYIATDTTYDVFPVHVSTTPIDWTADSSSDGAAPVLPGHSYWTMRRRQDGSEASASRDWQTRWMRSDSYVGSALGAGFSTYPMNTPFHSGNTGLGNPPGPARQNKPTPDGKWWLYPGAYFSENTFTASGITVAENRFIRGTITGRFYFIPADNWSSGDELTDTVSGTKYLLVAPDYGGAGAYRVRTATNTYLGGVAVAEI